MSRARLIFSLHTEAAKPYRVLLARATASVGVRKVIETSTGPNISVWAMVDEGDTLVKRVGGKKLPSVGHDHDGCHM